MKSKFFKTLTPILTRHLESFQEYHSLHFEDNKISILFNRDDSEALIKCCGDITIPEDFICTGIYSLEQAKELLSLEEWQKEF